METGSIVAIVVAAMATGVFLGGYLVSLKDIKSSSPVLIPTNLPPVPPTPQSLVPPSQTPTESAVEKELRLAQKENTEIVARMRAHNLRMANLELQRQLASQEHEHVVVGKPLTLVPEGSAPDQKGLSVIVRGYRIMPNGEVRIWVRLPLPCGWESFTGGYPGEVHKHVATCGMCQAELARLLAEQRVPRSAT